MEKGKGIARSSILDEYKRRHEPLDGDIVDRINRHYVDIDRNRYDGSCTRQDEKSLISPVRGAFAAAKPTAQGGCIHESWDQNKNKNDR